MRLALYAHYSDTNGLAPCTLFYLQKLRDLGYEICLISNSPIPRSEEVLLQDVCSRVIQRENVGYDFVMWQQGLAGYDLTTVEELLLTNSSVIGPLQPLAPLWDNPALSHCDFWGLTDNDEYGRHLQSYFLVFRRQVLQSAHFMEFWRSVLPYKDKQQVIQSYEIGLTLWLEEHGFKWRAIFTQEHFHSLFASRRSFFRMLSDRVHRRGIPHNTSAFMPDLLIERGMPFLKASLLRTGSTWVSAKATLRLLESSSLPPEIFEKVVSDARRART